MSESTATAERESVRAARELGRTTVVVIGAGINGIATFRDLAMQGVDVLLVEREDFASGATAASSHMIHGGIRYLENGEFRLVKESVTERNGLLKIAPHFVKPLQTTIPIYSTFSGIFAAPLRFLTHKQGRPQERGAFLIKIGLMLYDTFSRDGGNVPRHRFLGRRRSLEQLPKLDEEIKYTATYYDASVHDPERLALDVLRDGEAAHTGARALNYVEAVGLDGDRLRLRDRETGADFHVQADVIVNASGPWTDLTNEALGTATAFMGGTKGSHIVLDHPELLEATGGREIFFEHSDGRIVLIYPLKGRVLVGTTDIDADPREPARCTDEEVQYFFDLIGHVFPAIAVDRSQIVYRYSGIRPLPHHDDTAPGFVSRDYRIERRKDSGAPAVFSLVGGKWTTFRALGENLANHVLTELGRRRVASTAGVRIGGGNGYPKTPRRKLEWLRDNVGDDERGRVLFGRYGTRAADVAAFIADGEDSPVVGDLLSSRELRWMVENEQVCHVADVVFRRTSLAFTGDVDAGVIRAIAEGLAPYLGWDAARVDAEIDDTASKLRDAHGVDVAQAVAAGVVTGTASAGR
ncbi:glycerol-3-phosphate dehydrogenase/oxidase [Microbacterium aerolatum]|uniref:Glycerol-3-phosphate dehydrogenase n=1 Tax=Microbacterium aerolatum TaxID=153731 RepID=A0A511ACR8_9MICO|nr:glycerol-3-phosphate dehydrogenase/oxidase [Microbacterium aerolatum]GEK85940.1 glycerol-3-phosphate dehydrogenase [Microbacterium aerolatum]GGB28136.1 glycerol-3-phosphate dehydrogenase [Microbacterium aerolatum]